MKKQSKRSPLKVALALGGGGVRGFAHIGVLKALENDLPLHIITGTSMGAVVGARYALVPEVRSLEQMLLSVLQRPAMREMEQLVSESGMREEKKIILESILRFVKDVALMNLRMIKHRIFSGREIGMIFDALGLDTDFSRLVVPFACTSVDLRTGEEVVMRTGSVKEAILASTALPAVFPPVRQAGRLLVDGGIVGSVPIDAARKMGADLVIGVTVESDINYKKKLGTGLDIMFQADAIRAYTLNVEKIKSADFIIRPEVGGVPWAGFSQAAACIRAGERAALQVKPQLLRMIEQRERRIWWRKFFPLGG